MTRLTHLFHYTNTRTSHDLNVCALARTGHLTQWKDRHLAAIRPCAIRCTSFIRTEKGEGQNSTQCTQKLLKFKKLAAPKRWSKQTTFTHNCHTALGKCSMPHVRTSSLQENSTPIRNLKVTNYAVIHSKALGKIPFESNQ